MKPVKISNRNVMFTEPMPDYGCDLNIGLILGVKHNFVIDTGVGSGSVLPVLDYLKGDEKPIIVVNTHRDWDHMWGNWVFENSLIVAHRKCREFMEKNWETKLEMFGKYIDGEVRKCLPNLVFDSCLDFAEDGVSIFYTPGHTDSCITIYDSMDKVIHAGDNIGDTNDAIVPVINTDLETFKQLIETYKSIDFEICISGHNKPQGKDVVARMEAALPAAWTTQQTRNAN